MSHYKDAPQYNPDLVQVGNLIHPKPHIYPINMSYTRDSRVTSMNLYLDTDKGDSVTFPLAHIVCGACQLLARGCSGLNGETTTPRYLKDNSKRLEGRISLEGWPRDDSDWVIKWMPDKQRFMKVPAVGGVEIVGNFNENRNLGTSLCNPSEPIKPTH